MSDTQDFALAHGVCGDETIPAVENYDEPPAKTAAEIARRAIILHGVAAVGFGVDAEMVLDWLVSQGLQDDMSPAELQLFESSELTEQEGALAAWRIEAEWALLWTIGKVETLGLPNQSCDTGLLVDEIMPPLGESIEPFVASAQLRSPGEILAEDDRHYNLHCYVRQAMKTDSVPADLIYQALYQRCYAFEWLKGEEEWDDVRTDT